MVVLFITLIVLFMLYEGMGKGQVGKRNGANDTMSVIDSSLLLERRSFEKCVLSCKKKYMLTPRETEVFSLLVKGRNVAYISKTLCISVHTAKSHVYHIYRKTNICSQQALMDLFEAQSKNQKTERVA